MNITQSALIFLLSLFLVISAFCLLSCYYSWKRRHSTNIPAEQLDLLNGKVSLRESKYNDIELQPVKRNSSKINFIRLNEINSNEYSDTASNISKRILGSVDSIRTLKSDNRAQRQNHNPTIKHTFVTKILNYSPKGIQLLDREIRTVKKTKVFRELQWKEEVVESTNCNKFFYPTNSPHYFDVLEAMKLEEDDYKALRVKVSFDLTNCVDDREYLARDLSNSTSFETISLQEYKSEVERYSVH